MLLAASEGWHWRYEVCEHVDGYLVQMRDLETGDLDAEFSTVFRTLPVAFAYAEMSAAFERHASREDSIDVGDSFRELANSERHFIDLRDRLGDSGMHAVMAEPWISQPPKKKIRTIH